MAQPAVKRDQHPANDPDYASESEKATKVKSGENPGPSTDASIADNPVKRSVEEFSRLIDEMDDIRENLRANGIPLRTTRMIVEFGIQEKPDKQAMTIDSALDQARAQFGDGCIERSVLENDIATIVELERDLTHARSMAREAGLDAQALSTLTQMVQQNPGDGGAKAINTFLGYALAMGVKTDQLTGIVSELTAKPDSVLPQIARKVDVAETRPWRKIIIDSIVGLMIGIVVIWSLL
ncbi:MAG: hypothetical protein AB8B87_04765 [Granulosicoccus sp.]